MLLQGLAHFDGDRRPAAAIRIHAYEFGDRIDARQSGSAFQDLRATENFPASAIWRARLGAINIRRADLWRLLDTATVDGAIVVWPMSPADAFEPVFGGKQSTSHVATRVISLVRLSHPNVRAARSRASLNVRSIAVEEQDWRQHAPSLVALAPNLLRNEFDALFEFEPGRELYLPRRRQVPPQPTEHRASSPASLLLGRMGCGAPVRLGRETFETESEFWKSAAESLGHLTGEMRGQVSLASGFAIPFAPAAVCYSQDEHHSSRRFDASGAARELAGGNDGDREPFGLDRLDRLADLAFGLSQNGPAATWNARTLQQCENDLLSHLSVNGFLLPDELAQIEQSPALAALVRRIVERRPHAIVARLQTSLTILASFGAEAAPCIDHCLRKLLPPQWSAAQWLALFEEEWIIRRGLDAVQRARQLPHGDKADLERALLSRLACATLSAKPLGARRFGRHIVQAPRLSESNRA